jgi:hypothetical protein
LPFPLLAHQAPVLPLKLWRPSVFNGTALVLGSVAPDLEYLLTSHAYVTRGFAHTFAGQFLFCLPFTLAVVLAVGWLGLGEVLVARFGARFAWLVGAATDVAKPGGFKRACASALVGSFSHVAFDDLTHTWAPHWMPSGTLHFARLAFTSAAIAQLVASGCGVVLSIWLLRRVASLPHREAPARRAGASLVVALALLGAAGCLRRARPAIQHPNDYFQAGALYVWGEVAFFAACGAGAGVLVAGMSLAMWDRRKVRRDLTRGSE